jgi:hypothetical protein
MKENSMKKVAGKSYGRDSAYKPSAPKNYVPPTAVKVPVPTQKGK